MPAHPPKFQDLQFPLFPIIVLCIAFVLLILSISPYYNRREPIFVAYPTPTIIPTYTPIDDDTPYKYTCPKTEWIDCMPGPGKTNPQCQLEFLNWAKENCPNFKGAAL